MPRGHVPEREWTIPPAAPRLSPVHQIPSQYHCIHHQSKQQTNCWSPIVSTEGTGRQYNYLQSSKYISIPYEVVAASQWITCEQNTHTKHTIVVIVVVVVVNKYYDQWIWQKHCITKTRQFLKLCMVKGPQLCDWEKRKKKTTNKKQKNNNKTKKKQHFNYHIFNLLQDLLTVVVTEETGV